MKTHKTFRFALALLTVTAAGAFAGPVPTKHLASWPDSAAPLKVGRLVTDRFIATQHPNFGSPKPPDSITYPEVCAWYGALTFAQTAKQEDLTQKLLARAEPLLGEEAKLIPKPNHVDNTVFGGLAAELYLQTKDNRYLEISQRFAEQQWKPLPETLQTLRETDRERMKKGLSWQTRFWIDDMYMITLAQAQAFRITDKRKYIDRAAAEMIAYLKEIQEPNGLFHHASDAPFFWGRGNGWMAAGMTELLRSLPGDHPDRAAILLAYQKMMRTLCGFQGKDGMWRQLIDDPASWPESSCTGMFTFAMISGVKNGWLDDETYGPVARKGWIALTGYIEANGDVREVCIGTNKENNREHYMNRPRANGDMHGQAPLLWCATALLR